MECDSTRGIADVGQIHPRTNREGLTPFHHTNRAADVSAPGMAPALLPKLFPIPNHWTFNEIDFNHAIAALEYRNDVVHALLLGSALSRMRRGKDGQTSSVSLAGVLGVQTSRRLRRRGDPKTTLRHRRHTCTSVCHASISFLRK